jgi:hypothetical protein
LLADCLDHTIAERAARQLLDPLDDSVVILHRDRLDRAHAVGEIERERSARDRDHARAGIGGEFRQDRAEKPDADDRHCLPGLDLAAAKDVHGAAERLAGKRLPCKHFRQPHHGLRIGEVVLGI